MYLVINSLQEAATFAFLDPAMERVDNVFGYAGTILTVNLTTGTIDKKAVPVELARDYLGGIGFNARILYDEIPAGADPLGPDNVLAFGVGTLVGSPYPTASRTEASAKSPQTGQFGTSNSGYLFGSMVKNAGYDAMVFKGKAEKPVYVFIDNDRVEILDASFIWGKECWQTIDLLRQKHYGCEIALIGPAGENLVRFASIENGRHDGWGRSGLGAVMGSKLLKAVAVRGSKGITPFDPKGMLEVSWEGRQLIQSASSYNAFVEYGTMNATIPYGNFNALGTHNFSRGTLEGWKGRAGRQVVDEYSDRHVACQSCIIACGHWVEIKEGKYAGLKTKDLEITPTVAFAANVGLDLEATIKASEMCQRYGVDMVSMAGVIAMAMELYRDGLIKSEDLDYALEFGDDDAALALMKDIVYRQGIGDILAEGVKTAAGNIPGAQDYAIHIKGMEIPMIDPRGRWSTWTLGMLTNIRGGDHLRCRNPVENLRYNENEHDYTKERFGFKKPMYDRLDMPDPLKEQIINLEEDTVDIAMMARWAEDLINLYNAVGICIRPPVMEKVGPTALARAYQVYTGLPMTADEMMAAAERAWNVMKLFNIREGEDIGDLKFPRRLYREAVAGKVLEEGKVQNVLELYFQARGWEPATGRPTPDTLQRLGLKNQ